MNVIYTGNFSINWDYFKGLQGWHIKNYYELFNYSSRWGADFRVIDNSNKRLTNVYNMYRDLSNNKADGWNIGTLSSIVAIEDFINSPYDNFCWFDIDICVTKPYLNIFNCLSDDITLEYDKIYSSYGYHRKRKFVSGFLGINHEKYCNTGMFLLTKVGAYKLLNAIKNMGVDLTNEDFAKRLVDYYKNDHDFMSDECIIEAIVNYESDLIFNKTAELYHPFVIVPGDDINPYLDVFAYHFASSTKHSILNFWSKR